MGAGQRRKGARLCKCGCGQPAPLAAHTDSKRGWVRGEPLRYVHGHNTRKPLAAMYVVEDHGHPTPCWIWIGGANERGYGRTNWRGRMQPAHRVMFERAGGVVPPGYQLDHLCRVPACVNPDHLEPVTGAENARRRAVTKLNAEAVAAIRAARTQAIAASPLTASGAPRRRVPNGDAIRSALADRYGVRADYIKAIWRGDAWR